MARPRKQLPIRKTVAIVGDGQTERIYLSDIRDTDRPAGLTILPDYPRRIGDYKGVLERAMELVEDYSRVYALIDMDKIIQERQQAAYRQIIAQAEKKGVIVLENNPCFEIWLLLHFSGTGKLFNNCNQVAHELNKKDRIPGYDKTEKFQQNARLYGSYKKLLMSHAVPNARLLEKDRANKDELYPRGAIYKFFEWYFDMQQ